MRRYRFIELTVDEDGTPSRVTVHRDRIIVLWPERAGDYESRCRLILTGKQLVHARESYAEVASRLIGDHS